MNPLVFSQGKNIHVEVSVSDFADWTIRPLKTKDLDAAYSADCEYTGCSHSPEKQAAYNSLCALRRKKLKAPCLFCPAPHFDEVYVGGFCVDVGTDTDLSSWAIAISPTGIKVPIKVTELSTALTKMSEERVF